ncbi:pyrimidine operon attenuation protein / uracil phosphoribosyltransferase [Flavobacterium fontis]|uniref:Pyrimidine operon attenuation protein / uracil phosphoribosyltransferase n=1 Tax=Flavobacterium fontis TaxID=1124188 RepID=A0A1M5EG28_9FLAO|nr:phosphoribosyltransferase family protein [Flavobacterium fontis]SHF78179.1 pyrimidine operon attenuation protein / uracil phosphoribosyltransferase [Flavobacterium fontis]
MNEHRILDHQQIEHTLKRIAYQIYETFVSEEHIVLAGIASNGYILAQRLGAILESISPLKVELCAVNMNKQAPLEPITTSLAPEQYAHKGIVVVDDVLNSGSTLMYGVKHFLNVPVKKCKTVVLVDRNHKNYPIKVDFKGISLSTSLQEHVTVVLEKESYAFLS